MALGPPSFLSGQGQADFVTALFGSHLFGMASMGAR